MADFYALWKKYMEKYEYILANFWECRGRGGGGADDPHLMISLGVIARDVLFPLIDLKFNTPIGCSFEY